MKKEIINRTHTLVLKLDEVAKDFGYQLEADSYDDVFHDGYSAGTIKKMGLMIPEELKGCDQIFPHQVASALEDAERDAIAGAIVKYNLQALESALEKIDLSAGGAEYEYAGDTNEWISTKAGIISVVSNLKENTLTVEILNPEHLINTMVHGVGRFYPELSPYEPAQNSELIKGFHHLNSYFDVYGESKPSADLPSHESGDFNDTYFHDLIKENIGNLSLEDVAECIKEYAEENDGDENKQKALKLATDLTEYSRDDIVNAIVQKIFDNIEDQKAEVLKWN